MVPQRPPARAFLATVLDAGLIITASAAVVIRLGGRTRLDLGGIRITRRAATNLLASPRHSAPVRLYRFR